MFNNNEIEYFLSGASRENNRKASSKIPKQQQKEFEDVFNGIVCFDGMFSLQEKPDSKPYQVPQSILSTAETYKEELDRLQQQDIINTSRHRCYGRMAQQHCPHIQA